MLIRYGEVSEPKPSHGILSFTVTVTTVSYTHLDVYKRQDEAFDRLGSMMNDKAGFTSWNTDNSESIAYSWVV